MHSGTWTAVNSPFSIVISCLQTETQNIYRRVLTNWATNTTAWTALKSVACHYLKCTETMYCCCRRNSAMRAWQWSVNLSCIPPPQSARCHNSYIQCYTTLLPRKCHGYCTRDVAWCHVHSLIRSYQSQNSSYASTTTTKTKNKSPHEHKFIQLNSSPFLFMFACFSSPVHENFMLCAISKMCHRIYKKWFMII